MFDIAQVLRGLVAAAGTLLAPAPTFGINIDFGQIPAYANLVKHAQGLTSATAGPLALDAWLAPLGDFAIGFNLVETKRGPAGDSYAIRFEGRATLEPAGASIVQQAWDPATNLTTALLLVAADAGNPGLTFRNTRRLPGDTSATGIDTRTLTIMRPIAPGSAVHHDPAEKWNRQLRVAFAPWKGGYWRALDSNFANNFFAATPQTVGNRTPPYAPCQCVLNPTVGVSIEDMYSLANFLGMGLWVNFPDTGTPGLFQLWLDVAKYGSDAAGVPHTAAGGANPAPAAGPVNAPLAGKLYFEVGNEDWNNTPEFPQADRLNHVAFDNYATLNANHEVNPGGGLPPLDLTFCQVAWMLLGYADQARATFPGGLNTKYLPILATQSSGRSATMGAGMTWLKRHLALRGETIAQNIAATGGDGYSRTAVNLGDSSQTVDSVLAGGAAVNPGIAGDAVYAKSWGVPYASYECGISNAGNDLGIAVDHDPRFTPIVRDEVLNMVACGCRYITAYSAKRGDWSLLDSIWDLTHPKYFGWVAAIRFFPMDGSTPAPLPTAVAPGFADPSFEEVRIDAAAVADGFTYQPGGAWHYASASGINGPATGIINSGQPVPSGSQVLFLQGGPAPGSASQVVDGWIAGPYQIAGRMNRRLSSGECPFNVLVDGVIVGTFSPAPSVQFQAFTTPPFTVAAGSHIVTFAATAPGDVAAMLDDVAILGASTSVTPPTGPTNPTTPASPTATGLAVLLERLRVRR